MHEELRAVALSNRRGRCREFDCESRENVEVRLLGPSVGGCSADGVLWVGLGGAEAERSANDKGAISGSFVLFSRSSCNTSSREESDFREIGRDPLSLSVLNFGLSVTRARCAIALAAASAAQSELSRDGDVPATLTISVATMAGALAMEVND